VLTLVVAALVFINVRVALSCHRKGDDTGTTIAATAALLCAAGLSTLIGR